MEIAALIVSILAVLISGWAAWYGRGQKLAADRSAAAAEVSAQEARRSSDHSAELAAIERARRAEEEEAADRELVEFRLIPHGSEVYMLVNGGTGAAYGVQVRLEGPNRGAQEIAEFPAGHQEQYFLFHKRRATTVTWHQRADLSDEARTITLYP